MTENASGPLHGKTIVMFGGSRGIGLAIALRAARDGANFVLLAKTATRNERLQGTVHAASLAIERAGGRVQAVVGDVRSDEDIARAVDQVVDTFGGIDIVVYNASALVQSPTAEITSKQYDLMQDVNTRDTFMQTETRLPALMKSTSAKVLTLSPPLVLNSPYWLGRFPGYLPSKYGMSLHADVRRGVPERRHRRDVRLAADDDRGGRREEPARRKRCPGAHPASGDHGGCGLGNPRAPRSRLLRRPAHRRGRAARCRHLGFRPLCKRRDRDRYGSRLPPGADHSRRTDARGLTAH